MKRSPSTYLADIVEACAAIEQTLHNISLAKYRMESWIRSAVEREFAVMDEAVRALDAVAPEVCALIPESRRILDYCHTKTCEHAGGDDAAAYEYALSDVPELKCICLRLLEEIAGRR